MNSQNIFSFRLTRKPPSGVWGLVLLMLLSTSSCTEKFDAMNTDPNNPTKISAQYLLPYALERSIDRYWGGRTRFERLNLDGAMLWMQYLSRNIYSNEGDNYGISPAFQNNNWQSFYIESLTNFQRIISISGPQGSAPNANYEGVALVMRSWVFSIITDLWGA
ncbi:MAG: SusD/RagB family nutrient-binding outer membrane lipoprotein, partial [Runella sp.]